MAMNPVVCGFNDRLRATLGDLVEDGPERYQFTWAGKRDAIRLLQSPTRATLVPCREESVAFIFSHSAPTGKPLLYLVRETKSTHDRDKWHPDERRRVACGERHFRDALDVNYRVVTSARELP
jgi:hypothetical protein